MTKSSIANNKSRRCLKCVLDCLQKSKTIKNDNNCCKIVGRKFIDKENPRIEFKIVTIE